jgi:hypothetical protein
MKELKPTDLRIGNYVYNTEGKIDTVGIEAMKYIVAYGGTKICQVKPIELTEEWFLKFGFDSLDTSFGKLFEFRTGRYAWLIDNFGSLHLDYTEYENLANVKYVHELQNLYFALTGQELEVKF